MTTETKDLERAQPLAPGWDLALTVSSFLGWIVAGVVVLLPAMYSLVLHMFAIVGFFSVATSGSTRQLALDVQRSILQSVASRSRVSELLASVANVANIGNVAAASTGTKSINVPAAPPSIPQDDHVPP